jgi:hypothetical protein
MSESFIARWSRRKRTPAETSAPAEAEAEPAGGQTAPRSDPGEPAAAPFDPAALPSLESITAGTDIRGFLSPGVPLELRHAALRRAWSSDPAIRDFVGLADYDWDFHAPGSMPGFGSLEMTEELRREIARIVGEALQSPESASDAESAASSPETATDTDSETDSAGAIATEPVLAPPGGSIATVCTMEPAEPASIGHNSAGILPRSNAPIARGHDPEEPGTSPARAPRAHGRALPR